MNERIKELRYEAGILAYEEHEANCIKNGRDPSMPHANALDMTFEKFAELIVRECIFKIENEAAQYAEPVWSFELVNDIKEHFGVEE